MKKSIDQVDVKGKTVLLRADFNVPVENGEIQDDRRIRETLPTIRAILDRGGKVVAMSHLGRPKEDEFDPQWSLAPIARRLGELLGKPVAFPSAGDCSGPIDDAVKTLPAGAALLLENLRFHKGEKTGDTAFAAKIAPLGDIYCNDAFGTSHRADASMVALPTLMKGKPRVCGLLVKKEIAAFARALDKPAKPFVVVLGGAKASDKIPVVEHLLPRADAVLVGGAMAYTFLAALGRQTGESKVERDRLHDCKRILEKAASLKCDLMLPVDHVCSTEFSRTAGDIDVCEESIRPGFFGLDIGPVTQSRFARAIENARTVVWNGPMGVFEWAPFAVGTQQVALAMAVATTRGAVTILGGGETASAAEKFGVADKVTHVSTGGGASLDVMAGKPLPALEVLDDA
jgi:phosphoglycerate kinase